MKFFKKASCIAPQHDICRGFKFLELCDLVSTESFVDSSCGGIVE